MEALPHVIEAQTWEVPSRLTTRNSLLTTPTRSARIAVASQCGHVTSRFLTELSNDSNCSPNCECESITTCREEKRNYIVKSTFIFYPPSLKLQHNFLLCPVYPFYHQTHESQVHFSPAKGARVFQLLINVISCPFCNQKVDFAISANSALFTCPIPWWAFRIFPFLCM